LDVHCIQHSELIIENLEVGLGGGGIKGISRIAYGNKKQLPLHFKSYRYRDVQHTSKGTHLISGVKDNYGKHTVIKVGRSFLVICLVIGKFVTGENLLA
jgi:hypothetical protein